MKNDKNDKTEMPEEALKELGGFDEVHDGKDESR